MPKYTGLQCTIWWALWTLTLEGASVHCPASCICDLDMRSRKVKQISCTDSIFDRRLVLLRGNPLQRFSRSIKGHSEQNEVIEKVSLIYAGLSSVPSGAFGRIRVFNLDLQGNNFQHRISPKAFAGVGKTLRSLNLEWSNVTELHPKVFRGMVPLRNLSLAENHIREIPATIFHHLRSLRKLSLAGNPISHLPGTIFRYQTTLETLDLGYCRLKRLPWTLFIGLWNLKNLDLRGNRLSYLDPYTFIDLSLLDTLLLGHNPIRRLPTDAFHGLQHLTVLRLGESQIEHVTYDVFRDLEHLKVLDLSDNEIEYLSPGTLSLSSLERLRLDGNRLVVFPMDVRLMPRLQSLDVSYNRISTINACLYDHLRHLDFFNIQENPLHCDCNLLWLKALRVHMQKKWQEKTGDKFQRSIPLLPGRCASPDTLRGVGSTSWMDFDCLHQYHLQMSHSRRKRNKHGDNPENEDVCDAPSGYFDNRIDFRRRNIRHLAYLSRDLHYMYRHTG